MTLVPGNALTLALGKQSAKGTPQATPQAKLDYIGGFGPEPNWATLQTAETDAQRQQADRPGRLQRRRPGRALRPPRREPHPRARGPRRHRHHRLDEQDARRDADHRRRSSVLHPLPCRRRDLRGHRDVDCQASQVQWTGGAGQALSTQVDWVGLSAILGATDPAGVVSVQDILVYPDVIATWGGTHDGSVQSFQVTVNQNRTPWIGDTGVTAFDIVPGILEVTAQLVMLFQNDQEYRNFIGGSTSATTPAVAIPSKSLSIIAAIDANNSVQWDMAAAKITAYSRGHNTDGSPLLATLTLKSKKDVTTIGNVITVTTKNTKAAP
jgi:hypothetical protein